MAAAVVLAAVPATAVACSSDDSASTTTSTTTTAPKNFQVSTSKGQVSLSLDGELPPGWPADFPVPKSAEPAGSGSIGGSDSTVRVAVYTTSDPGQKTLDFYTNNSELKTKAQSSAGSGESFVGSADLVSPFEGGVTVLSRDGKGYLIVTLNGSGGTSPSSSDTSTTTASG